LLFEFLRFSYLTRLRTSIQLHARIIREILYYTYILRFSQTTKSQPNLHTCVSKYDTIKLNRINTRIKLDKGRTAW